MKNLPKISIKEVYDLWMYTRTTYTTHTYSNSIRHTADLICYSFKFQEWFQDFRKTNDIRDDGVAMNEFFKFLEDTNELIMFYRQLLELK